MKNYICPAVVPVPIACQDPAFGFQLLKQTSAQEGRQDVEGGILYFGIIQKIHRLAKDAWGVAVEAEDNPDLHGDPIGMDFLDDAMIFVNWLKRL